MFKKINNNQFLKSTIILLFGGIFGKLIGFIIKIVVTRHLGTEGMGLYSMLNPTNALLTTLAVFSYSNAVSKIVSLEETRTKNIFISLIPISIIINLFIITIVVLISKTLASSLNNIN